jgi:peptidoglycan/xylan/chitin deacetylase (PgdA/CDA1 family)
MNLVSFSLKTKGLHNFTRRLWTVFTRFGFSEIPTRRALYTIVDALQPCHAAPTFFIPAVVLNRHSALIADLTSHGAEIGIHGYVHNDYRLLTESDQYKQTRQAISVFKDRQIPYRGFRNPYLGWTEASQHIFDRVGLAYESNHAVLHDVINLDSLSPTIKSGYEKSQALFQAIPCTRYTLRPHFEGTLLSIPVSIPDDEMLVDRLRMTNAEKVGRIWCTIMQHVYDLGGLYTLNLHPERALLCKRALDTLLSYVCQQPLPVWVARLEDITQWWKERSQFRLHITPQAADRWNIEAICPSGATLLARRLIVEDQRTSFWYGADERVQARCFTVRASQCPCIAVSPQTPQQVADFLLEQGYPTVRCAQEEAHTYAWYLDMPEGLGATREHHRQRCNALLNNVEQQEAPLLHFGCWPDGSRAALAVTGDIDSVTIQDFFLRILEVHHHR